MPTRTVRFVDADRRARQRVEQVLDECRQSRIRAGLSQADVAAAIGRSRQLVTALEAGRLRDVGLMTLARYATAVGLEMSVRAYPAGAPLRDIGQVRLLERFRTLVGPRWSWRTEVPVSRDPGDRRAFDAILTHASDRIGVEAITRLVDGQGQIRPIMQKQAVSGLECVILLLADTRHNRAAIIAAGSSLRSNFPVHAREVLRDLRAGRAPTGNGLVLA
jgi:DNA-binding XRE family transcriptional regulator